MPNFEWKLIPVGEFGCVRQAVRTISDEEFLCECRRSWEQEQLDNRFGLAHVAGPAIVRIKIKLAELQGGIEP